MKYLIAILFFLILVTPVNAQMFDRVNRGVNEDTPKNGMANPEEREQLKQNLQKNLQNAGEERQLQVKENVQNRLSNMVQNHVNRLEKRFNMYNTRLSAVIAKMESNEVIIANTEAVNTLNTAKQDLQEANDMAKQTLDALKTIQTSTNIERSSLEQVKTLARQTVDLYKSVHTDLMTIVSLVRSN